MDADTRHQLKTNELAEMLGGLKDLKKPQYLYPGLAVLVVLIAVAAWYGWQYSQRVGAEQDWQRLQRIMVGLSSGDPSAVGGAQSELRAMLQEKVQPSVLGYARIELARSRVEQGLAQPTERPGAFEEAARLLEEVLQDPATTDMQRAQATFLLASTYESLRQFDRAKELYLALQNARYAGSPYRAMAEKRLTDIDQLSKPIAFAPGEAPPPPAPPAPTTQGVLAPQMMGPPAPPEATIPLTRMPQGPPAPQPQSPQPQPPTPQPEPPAPPPQPREDEAPAEPPAEEPSPTP